MPINAQYLWIGVGETRVLTEVNVDGIASVNAPHLVGRTEAVAA
ncbi:hypothetical protein ACFT7S_27495 [Streptomyces sp. NPDC057136]